MKPTDLGRSASSLGIATGLVAPLALGAPGNLDPGFADHGRLALDNEWLTQAWTVEALDDGRIFVAGGEPIGPVDWDCGWYYECDWGDNFAVELSANGAPDAGFAAARPTNIEVRDAIRQPDGKIIMVGRWVDESAPDVQSLAVYRLEADGALDASFGTQGIFLLPTDAYGERNQASSAVLDPDGRIVVSGASADHLIVLRLLADGRLDASFGDGGVFSGPAHDYESRTFIERTGAGYRVSATGDSRCEIVGLTSGGAIDNSFGAAGVAPVQTALGEATACNAMTSQPDGNLLLSGTAAEQPFVTRMLATGAPDPAFSAGTVADVMTDATAIAVDDTGQILVAGSGASGTLVMRLDAAGGLDASFGEAGTTFIDLESAYGFQTRISALDMGLDGRLLVAGGIVDYGTPFVVQMLGDGAAGSPGILSIVPSTAAAMEGEELVVKVRRSGGNSGAISVDFTTALGDSDSHPAQATPDDDYIETSGTLTWADGDSSEREILVSVMNNDGQIMAPPEDPEAFRVELRAPQGGAGLGTKNRLAVIRADGSPGGQLALEVIQPNVSEGTFVDVLVHRLYYFDGPVSVTVLASTGTASEGADFDATPITLTWEDQDAQPKSARIRIVDDADEEPIESFYIALSDATGAIIGASGTSAATIRANDSQLPRGGGGGSTGWLSVLLLGLAELLRRSLAPRAAPIRLRPRR